jgi:hypothetical protein
MSWSNMILRRHHHLLFLAALLLAVTAAEAFFVPFIHSRNAAVGLTIIPEAALKTPALSKSSSALDMVGMSPTNPDSEHKKNPIVFLGALLLAMLIAMAKPLPPPLMQQVHPSGLESSSHIVSKLVIQPLPGVGFGGVGVGPGWFPMPFGGFGGGFTIRNQPSELQPPATTEQTLQAQKQKLQAAQEYEKQLQAQIKAMEQQQQQKND